MAFELEIRVRLVRAAVYKCDGRSCGPEPFSHTFDWCPNRPPELEAICEVGGQTWRGRGNTAKGAVADLCNRLPYKLRPENSK